jgi:hypothetical protein
MKEAVPEGRQKFLTSIDPNNSDEMRGNQRIRDLLNENADFCRPFRDSPYNLVHSPTNELVGYYR